MSKSLAGIDFVYGCFFLCGLIILTLIIGTIIPVDDNTSTGLGFMVGIPLTILLLLIMLIAVLSTIFFRRNEQLILLSIMTVLLFIVSLSGRPYIQTGGLLIYLIATLGIPISWFFVYRKRELSEDT